MGGFLFKIFFLENVSWSTRGVFTEKQRFLLLQGGRVEKQKTFAQPFLKGAKEERNCTAQLPNTEKNNKKQTTDVSTYVWQRHFCRLELTHVVLLISLLTNRKFSRDQQFQGRRKEKHIPFQIISSFVMCRFLRHRLPTPMLPFSRIFFQQPRSLSGSGAGFLWCSAGVLG